MLYSLYNNSGTTGLQVVLKGEVVVSGNPQSDFVPLRYSNLKYIPMTHALPDGEDNELLTFHFNSFASCTKRFGHCIGVNTTQKASTMYF